MTNYTTETYQIKRDFINFSNKLSKGCTKATNKFCGDMEYCLERVLCYQK